MNQQKQIHAETAARNWAESLTVPYRFPAMMPQGQLDGLAGLVARFSYLFKTSEVDKPTGLENFDRDSFVKEAYRHDIFYPTRASQILMTARWDTMLERDALKQKDSRPFVSAMHKEISGQNIIELGAGERGAEHGIIFRGLFGAASYTAVDIREEVTRCGGVQADALQFLIKKPDQSAIVVAFGLFNEPLSPINQTSSLDFMWPARSPEQASRRQWEQEYLRRLAREISRVTPEGAVLFGDGIHPIDANFDFDHYLQGSGFHHDVGLYTELAKSPSIQPRSPFIMRKAVNR